MFDAFWRSYESFWVGFRSIWAVGLELGGAWQFLSAHYTSINLVTDTYLMKFWRNFRDMIKRRENCVYTLLYEKYMVLSCHSKVVHLHSVYTHITEIWDLLGNKKNIMCSMHYILFIFVFSKLPSMSPYQQPSTVSMSPESYAFNKHKNIKLKVIKFATHTQPDKLWNLGKLSVTSFHFALTRFAFSWLVWSAFS